MSISSDGGEPVHLLQPDTFAFVRTESHMQVGDLQALLTPNACSPITVEGK